MRIRAVTRAAIVGIFVVLGAARCDRPTGPSPTSPSTVLPPATNGEPSPTVSGTVWRHAPGEVTPYANAVLFGWIESGGRGQTTGRVPIGSDGRYSLFATPGSRVRIYAGNGGYQPCAVTLTAISGGVTRDVHVVVDRRQLGAHLPSQLLANTASLSGVVFEVVEDGRRVPLPDVRVELDGLSGLGVVTATTLSDEQGRYVLCGLEGEASTYTFASKAGYRLFEAMTALSGNTELDIELHR